MSKTCKNLALREIIHKHTHRSNRRAICTFQPPLFNMRGYRMLKNDGSQWI